MGGRVFTRSAHLSRLASKAKWEVVPNPALPATVLCYPGQALAVSGLGSSPGPKMLGDPHPPKLRPGLGSTEAL